MNIQEQKSHLHQKFGKTINQILNLKVNKPVAKSCVKKFIENKDERMRQVNKRVYNDP